jgi:chorismate dehydratase
MLRIGCVKYLNARPLIWGWDGGQVDFDHPSALCNKLAASELDVALVSSFEFLRNPIYRIVDDVSISSNGPVYSVFVAHRGEFRDVEEIELDPASQTSANLLRSLLAELGLHPRLVRKSDRRPSVTDHRAQLLIGDQAIRFRQAHAREFSFWDLGDQWKKRFNIPFVYALWLVRPEVDDPQQIAERLRNLRDTNYSHLDRLIENAVVAANDPGCEWQLTREFVSNYYQKHLRFGFSEKEREGIRMFAGLCVKHGLLPKDDLTLSVV